MDHPSVWMAGRTPAVPPPEGRVDTAPLEVLILGGGLCGLLTAFRLYEKGVRAMAVLEAGEIAGGTSAHTTAKVTAQHGLLYAGLRKGLGEERAGQYAKANQGAVGEYAAVMEQLGLRDELKRCASYLYTDDPAYVERLEQEAEACRLLDLPVSVTVETELPFPVLTAVRMDGRPASIPCVSRMRWPDGWWKRESGSIPTPAPIPPKRTRRPGISGPTGAPCMRTRSFSPPITLSWIKAASILPGSGRSAPMSWP